MKTSVKKRGFTIVELVIVIAVIAILAAVLIPTFGNIIDKAKESATMQEAMGAYTEYLIDHAVEADDAEYLFYKTEIKVVVIKNGASFGVYETEEEALRAAFDDPETSEDESAGCTLNTLGIDGLYFMQSAEQTECEHSYESVVTPPTCVNGGYTTHTCTLCGDEYTDSETAATGEHNYTDGMCACGAEKPIAAGVIVGTIGNTENEEEWCFDIVTTEQAGIYEAVIKPKNSKYSTDNLNFVYYATQLMDDDISEAVPYKESGYKGFELTKAGEINEIKRNENEVKRIQLPSANEYKLILDFNTMTWSVEKVQ